MRSKDTRSEVEFDSLVSRRQVFYVAFVRLPHLSHYDTVYPAHLLVVHLSSCGTSTNGCVLLDFALNHIQTDTRHE